MNRTNFERRNELIAAGLLGVIIGGLGVLGYTNEQKAEDEARTSDMAVLTEQVLLLHDDISDICRSLPEDPNSPELSSEDTTISHPPLTTPTTTPGFYPTSTGEKPLSLDKFVRREESPPSPTTTTTIFQPPPCP
jgi:hypothetical protein